MFCSNIRIFNLYIRYKGEDSTFHEIRNGDVFRCVMLIVTNDDPWGDRLGCQKGKF